MQKLDPSGIALDADLSEEHCTQWDTKKSGMLMGMINLNLLELQ